MRSFLAILLFLSLQSCSTTSNKPHSSVYCHACARSEDGHIHRDMNAKKEFMKQSGYPNGRQGYVVDHIVPLYKGVFNGATPFNEHGFAFIWKGAVRTRINTRAQPA